MTTPLNRDLGARSSPSNASNASTTRPPSEGVDWVPAHFDQPIRVAVTRHHHLRPVRADDVDLLLPVSTGQRRGLDRRRHRRDITGRRSFDYALVDRREITRCGGVSIDPATRIGFDAEVSWWVVDDEVGGDLETALDALVPTWIRVRWPFVAPVYPGHDLTWTEYLAQPTR